jgi:UDP-3-O-[3-hydroxymyristoyl] glucosamine N-acyltransferase
MARSAGLAISPPIELVRLAERHGGLVDEEARSRVVARVAPLEDGREGDLCPLTSRRYASLALAAAGAGASLLVDAELASLVPAGRRWLHPRAAWALARILSDLAPPPEPDRRDRASVAADAEIAEDVSIGAGALVMGGASIGAGSIVEPHAVIYPRVRIGARVVVGAGAVIGRPGFGWATGPRGELVRIPQLGGVWIEDDVEVGPLATIDAGTLAPTVVERGAKLDAHVHVGHNVVVGPDAMVAAQSGFAGSVRIGARARVGGQAGVTDHARVGEGAQVAAKAGVIGDIPAGAVVAGYPAVSRARWLRGVARMLAAARRSTR